MMPNDSKQIAYFSMEIALDPAMPTYSGGLGILAGDTLRAAAEQNLPMVAVTLLHRQGYFRQKLDAHGRQTEEPDVWPIEKFVRELPERATVRIEGRPVQIRAWQFNVRGSSGVIPVYLLDTNLPENSAYDRTLTDQLYGGDNWHRLCQEIILGIGGVRILRALGHNSLRRFHMNEGHAALLTVELLDEHTRSAGRSQFNEDDVQAVHQLCVFTTHTPVPAGHDHFPVEMVDRALGHRQDWSAYHEVICRDNELNMTYLALSLSHYVNGVAKKHGEVSQHMFARYKIDAITNGVHVGTWLSPSFQKLFDQHIAGWRDDNFMLRSALGIPPKEIWEAHADAKAALLARVSHDTKIDMDATVFTLGFARRATPYKRADLLFQDLERLKKIAATAGKLQIIYAGKAHPRDEGGKHLIQHIVEAEQALQGSITAAFLPNYDWQLGRLITAGVDVWLNTPQPPQEASGTSGMKAAVNGVPSLSILDGWWIEGWIEGVTGWSIDHSENDGMSFDANSLYEKLERVVLPLYYCDRNRFVDVMRHAIALNGSFFNTQRMMLQYALKAYLE